MTPLNEHLKYLKLAYFCEYYESLAKQAAKDNHSHVKYLTNLAEGEANRRQERAVGRRIRQARFPVIKTLEQFSWTWPKKINRPQIQNFFRAKFIEEKSNVVFLGGVGLGKTHLAIALGYEACLKGHSVLFTSTIEAINTLIAAKKAGRLRYELNKYLKPALLILDELGYLPIDKQGADLLFQMISGRYERGSLLITSNRAYKAWSEIFNNDATLTSAALDRLVHHCETTIIEGSSYRTRERVET